MQGFHAREQSPLVRPPKVVGGTAAAERTWAIITAIQGVTPPFVYSAVEGTLGAVGTASVKSGGRTWTRTLYNLMDNVLSGNGSLPVDAVVEVFEGSGGDWSFNMPWYKGTYG